MGKKEFEYNFYFEKYKDTSVLCHWVFKKNFKKDNPNVDIDLRTLLIDIEKYQVKKYGSIKFSDGYMFYPNKDEIKKIVQCDIAKKNRKFGNKEERNIRNIKQKRGEL